MDPIPSPLKVSVVGAGIAGLSTALALRRAGHIVTVYERSSLLREVGAAIHVPPNAARALLAWGLDPIQARFVTVRYAWRGDPDLQDGDEDDGGRDIFDRGQDQLSRSVIAGIETRHGAPWYLAHRVDFHEELRRLATETEGSGTPVVVHTCAHVIGYNPDAPSITLVNGTVVQSDMVVGSDGVHSVAIEAILGRPHAPVPSRDLYNFCYRFLISAEDIQADPETRFWNEEDDGRIKFFVKEKRRLVSYPCRNNEVHNFAALFHEEDISNMKPEDWQAPVEKSKLLERYSDFHPRIRAVINKATDVKQWALLYRPPIPTWIKGNMCLAGDAAHPMLPHQGQGGAMAIEDALVLGLVCCRAKSQDVPNRLRLYDSIRRNRASILQVFSNAGQDEPELVHQEASQYIPLDQIPKSPQEFSEYNFGYDAVQDSINRMRELDPLFEVPAVFFKNKPARGTFPKESNSATSQVDMGPFMSPKNSAVHVETVENTTVVN